MSLPLVTLRDDRALNVSFDVQAPALREGQALVVSVVVTTQLCCFALFPSLPVSIPLRRPRLRRAA